MLCMTLCWLGVVTQRESNVVHWCWGATCDYCDGWATYDYGAVVGGDTPLIDDNGNHRVTMAIIDGSLGGDG
ncbi:hypothetical protein GYH30_047350 [Glycine max]|nr:hypothetical protein GYH30_047350 [Glycine max]